MDTAKNYSIGVEAGLDALEKINKIILADENQLEFCNALAGLLTIVMHCTYASAPTEEVAEEFISAAQRMSLEDWEEENGIES